MSKLAALRAPDPTLATSSRPVWWIIIIKVAGHLPVPAAVADPDDLGRAADHRPDAEPARPEPRRARSGCCSRSRTALKLALKEDIVPRQVDKLLFRWPRSLSAVPALISFAIIPVGPEVSIFGVHTPLQLTDLPVAVLLVLAMSSIGVYGIVLAGWGSRLAVLAARRAAVLGPGDQLRDRHGPVLRGRVPVRRDAVHHRHRQAQATAGCSPGRWGSRCRPGTWSCCPSFLIYIITMVGETNRLPFDLPEGEGELVAGYHTEYSSLKFALFYLAEYVNMFTVSALAITLFLGGWRAPWPISMWAGANTAGTRSLVPGQGRAVRLLLRLAARLAAPGPLRPADGARLEGTDPDLARLARC